MATETASARFPSASAGARNLWAAVAFGALAALGTCLTLNARANSDGTWPLYAKMLDQNVKLYSDLHLPQQPFYILETAFWGSILGDAWLMSVIPTTLHMLLYILGFFLIYRKYAWSPIESILVFFCSAVIGVGWASYRFDDYRAISDTCGLLVIALLAWTGPVAPKASNTRWRLIAAGALCGIAFTTRPNDGLFLYLGAAVVVFHRYAARRWIALLTHLAGSVAAVLIVVYLTGDSLAAWARDTLLASHGLKGGSAHLVATPFALIGEILHYISYPVILLLGMVLGLCAAVPFLSARLVERVGARNRGWLILVARLATLSAYAWTIRLFDHLASDALANLFCAFALLAIYPLGVAGLLRSVGLLRKLNSRVVLMAIPLGAVAAGAMSSSGTHTGMFTPVALLTALLPIVFEGSPRLATWRLYVVGLIALASAGILNGRAEKPLNWENYQAPPMFTRRTWVQAPGLGEVYIENHAARFFARVCDDIHAAPEPRTLLSMPYSYANYFCGLEPWRGEVQTFFDTTSPDVVMRLIGELKTQPPTWIVYQRQIKYLRLSELLYNGGHPLAQRPLDELIEAQLARGEWRIVEQWTERSDDDWMLIRTTRPNDKPPS